MRVIDLTHVYHDHMPVYPGDPAARLMAIASIATEGFSDHELRAGLHVGTHIDAPMHMIAGGMQLSDIPPERFIGRGRVLDARGKVEIDADLLTDADLQVGDIVLVCTGWSAHLGEDTYFQEFPAVTDAFAQALVDAGAHMLCLDTPTPDRPPFPVHKILLGSGVLIAENLTNLEALLTVPSFIVFALPAKLAADAAPARVIAVIA